MVIPIITLSYAALAVAAFHALSPAAKARRRINKSAGAVMAGAQVVAVESW